MVVENTVKIYSSGTLVWEGNSSYEAILEEGENDLLVVSSGGIAAETSMGAGTRIVASSGAILSGININDEGAVVSGAGVICSGAEKWYGPVLCATSGVIVLEGGEFTDNHTFTSNGYQGHGGVIETYYGRLDITGGFYASNSATGGGGAILTIGGTTQIADAAFLANSAVYGGAVEVSNEVAATISGAVFSANRAEYGGAFEVHQGGSALISGTTFVGNSAVSGGAVMNDTYQKKVSYLTAENTLFSANSAVQGGALLNDGVLAVSGGTFTENTAEYGGAALFGSGATAGISGAVFSSNTAIFNATGKTGGMGGALYISGGAAVTTAETLFASNTAQVDPEDEWNGGCGGAVINYGSFTVSGGAFSANAAYYGGGIYNQAGDAGAVTVTGTDFADNSADYAGGAICNCWGTLTVSGGNFTGNSAGSNDGGAIANWSTAEISGAVFTGNSANAGGAVSNSWAFSLTVTDTFFGNNTAQTGGAFCQDNGGTATIRNCSFEGNSAALAGGALWNSSEILLADCIFETETDTIWNSGTITVSGENTFAGAVENGENGVFDVSLAEAAPGADAVVNGWSKLSGGTVGIVVSAGMADGVYTVASGVGTWSGDIALTVGAAKTAQAFTLVNGEVTKSTVVSGGKSFELSADAGGLLTLSAAAAVETAGDLNADGRADVLLANDAGFTGAWFIQNDQTPAWGDLSTLNAGWEFFGTGTTASGKSTDDVYIVSADNVIGA